MQGRGIWLSALQELFDDLIMELSCFKHILNGLDKLRDLTPTLDFRSNHDEAFQANKEYVETLFDVETCMIHGYVSLTRKFLAAWSTSPPVLKYSHQVDLKASANQPEILLQMRLLVNDLMEIEYTSKSLLVDDMERLIHKDPSAKDFMDPFSAMILAKMSIIHDGVRHFTRAQPWTGLIGMVTIAQTFRDLVLARFTISSEDCKDGGLVDLAIPKNDKFHYPIESKWKPESNLAIRTAEHNLDSFWVAFDMIHATDPSHYKTWQWKEAVGPWDGQLRHEYEGEDEFERPQAEDVAEKTAVELQVREVPIVCRRLSPKFLVALSAQREQQALRTVSGRGDS